MSVTAQTNAERQKAYRERKRAGGEEPDAAAEPAPGKPIPPPTPCPPPRVELDQYVQDAITGAELHHAAASQLATLSTKTLADAIERAEHYARWRYQGVLDGEVNGL